MSKPELMTLEMERVPDEMANVLEWFNHSVARLEGAYQDLGIQFEKVNRELDETNRRLELNQKRLNALLQSMNTGVIMVDPDRRVTVTNPAALRLLQVEQQDLEDRRLEEVFSPDSGVGKSLEKALNRETVAQEERMLRLPDGDVPVAVTGCPVIDSEGNLLGAVETFTDLSDSKRMLAEMQQDRVLRALGEMAATVAHEIRNPLGGIGGYAGLLARGIAAEDPKRKLVDQIIQGVSSLNKIVSNLLVYTRQTQVQRVPVDLVEWMESVLAHAEIEIEKEHLEIEIIRDLPEHPIITELDPERFQQVVLNLLFNAMQAISSAGEIHVGIREKGSDVVFQIADNGEGMSSEQMEQIFTPFYTTKEQGTGLGLAIVKKMVELHEGRIEVTSEVARGTCFTIHLPKRG